MIIAYYTVLHFFFPLYKDSGLPQGSLSRTSFSDVSCSDEETKMKTSKLKDFNVFVG